MRIFRITTPNGPQLAVLAGDRLFGADGDLSLGSDGKPQITIDYALDFGPLKEAKLLAPVEPSKVIAIGANYLDHIREAGMEPPPAPLIFSKFPSSVTGPDAPIEIDPTLTNRVDWEVELAVVIGSKMKNVPEESVYDYVLGYTACNDVSARDVQFGDGQWVRGKSFDTFCPIGPSIVTRDEISDPQNLDLSCIVNGETVQSSNTKEMLFKIPHLLSYCSRCFTLEPGDLILTGTPWGCGEFMTPPRSLHDGDIVEVHVEKVGKIANPVSIMSVNDMPHAAE